MIFALNRVARLVQILVLDAHKHDLLKAGPRLSAPLAPVTVTVCIKVAPELVRDNYRPLRAPLFSASEEAAGGREVSRAKTRWAISMSVLCGDFIWSR